MNLVSFHCNNGIKIALHPFLNLNRNVFSLGCPGLFSLSESLVSDWLLLLVFTKSCRQMLHYHQKVWMKTKSTACSWMVYCEYCECIASYNSTSSSPLHTAGSVYRHRGFKADKSDCVQLYWEHLYSDGSDQDLFHAGIYFLGSRGPLGTPTSISWKTQGYGLWISCFIL